ncbi:hypothetical protein BS47DRAFT_1370453 [Hydnum rufescens UP504]|uniref:Protein CASP n=1 Tax=Hydnum rufescens UP504 TaxID=1448309 RepID=A0A9P6BA11_9AGAM|nr:hypothetical protein BS47DRAFT_1370453 [Hydnum rufescens UP504]
MAGSERNFSGALAAWKDINLTQLQKTLDTQGIELVENQKESLVGRKALADRTKEFKRIPDEEKLGAFKTLLKGTQLNKRSKASENAFLSVYKLFADAPDPYPLLEAAVDQAVKVAEAEILESEVNRLREENADLRKRATEIPNLESAAKKAEARAELLEGKMEALIEEKIVQKENELNATYDEKMINYEERERDLQRQLTLTKDQLRDLRTSNESNQAKLIDQGERQDQEVVARLAEVDMIVADLERANSRVAAVERRNELLRAEIESVRSGSEAENRVKALDANIVELEAETRRLLRALEIQKDTNASTEQMAQKRVEDISKELASKAGDIESLRSQIRQYQDYDEIKRELEIMKYVEFAGADLDGDEGSGGDGDVRMPDPNAQKANQQQAKSLEALVLAKNKRILEELTRYRILHGELERSLQSVTSELSHNRLELEQQKALNERIENDLVQLNSHMPSANGVSSTPGASTPREPAGHERGLADLNLGQKDAIQTSYKSVPTPFSSSADTSILPIVTSQRDRFRQRNAELEEELRKQFEIISDLRGDIKILQQDNLKLYEKVRYMQSYRDESAASSSTYVPGPANAVPTRPDEMTKYKSMYEERMNPFEAFRGKYRRLNPVERGVFALTRAILGNRRARLAFSLIRGSIALIGLNDTLWII